MVCGAAQTADGEVGLGVGSLGSMNDAIDVFPRLKARTVRFTCGAPRSARTIGDGSRALFLRSDGPEDTVTSLWMSVIDTTGTGDDREVLLADPRELPPAPMRRTFPPKNVRDASVRAKAAPESLPIPSIRPDVASCSPSTASCS